MFHNSVSVPNLIVITEYYYTLVSLSDNDNELGITINDTRTTDTKLIDKIINEGYYINHTIGMLIYVAKCIGCSINSEKNGDDDDKFNSIEKDVMDEMNKYVMGYNNNNKYGRGQTRILVDGLEFKDLIKQSTIWIQILFSFLYWNEENEKTNQKMINACLEGNNDNNITKYIKEQFDNDDKKTNIINRFSDEKFSNGIDNNILDELNQKTEEVKNFIKSGDDNIIVLLTLKDNDSFEIHDDKKIIKKKQDELNKNIDDNFFNTELKTVEMVYNKLTNKFIKDTKITNLIKNITGDKQENNKQNKYSDLNIYIQGQILLNFSINDNEQKNLISMRYDTVSSLINKSEKFINKVIQEICELKEFNLLTAYNKKHEEYKKNNLENINNQKILNELLNYKNEQLKTLFNYYDKKEFEYKELTEKINEFNSLLKCYKSGYGNEDSFDKEKLKVTNQINRIKDGRIGATKMVLMHVVTGQEFKYEMVKETIGLTTTLFDSTQINLK